jgi:hypothetical protein
MDPEKFHVWIDLYEGPNDKVVKVIAFQLSDEAAIWYATLAPKITNNLQRPNCCELPKLYDNEDGELIVLVTCVGILVDVITVLSLLTIVKLLNKLSMLLTQSILHLHCHRYIN